MVFGFGFGGPRGVGGGWFNPASLFSSGESGVWYDPSDLTTLFQDTAGTTPVTAPGQTVALMRDKSGNNISAEPVNATLQQTADGLYYIQYASGGSLEINFGSALGVTCSVAFLQPDRQAYQTRTNVNVGSTLTYTENHGPIIIIARNITPVENVSLNTWARLELNGVDFMPWTRNPAWLSLPTVGDTEQKFVGLIAVFEQANFTALSAAGAYTVDWGDGTVEDFASGATATHEYDFADADLANTNAPVTLTSATNTVSRTAHGYNNGDVIYLWNVSGSTGVASGQAYYVINKTDDTFQISETLYGSPVVLGADGTATLLNYKQAIVLVTPQAGQNLTSFNLNVKHTQAGLQTYEAGWLDVAVGSPNFTSGSSLTIGGSVETVRKNMLERAYVVNPGGMTSADSMFRNLRCLQSVPLFDTAAVTNMISMFSVCNSLQSVPLFNTAAVTSMTSMFQGCFSLQSVPLFNTAAVTSMISMFLGCSSLQSVPLFDTAAVTTMTSMFNGCNSLQSVPLFNTAAVTTMTSMFNGCYVLQSVPLFNTAAVTSMSGIFQACNSLQSVPLFNTAAVTSMSGIFQNCYNLQSVPLFNTAAVTNMTNMFQNCSSLQSVPLFDTAAVTNMSGMFQNCLSLQSVPLFNTAAVTNMTNMFQNCYSLQSVPSLNVSAVTSTTNFAGMFTACGSVSRIQAKDFNFSFSVANCKLSGAALDEIYTNLPIVVGQTITVTGNYGTAAHDPTIATAKGWTVTV